MDFGIRSVPPCPDCWPDGHCAMNCGPSAPPKRPGAPLKVRPDYTRYLVKKIAEDVGKTVAAHVEQMYPDSVKSKSMLTSIKNCTFNAIMAAVVVTDAGEIEARLKQNDQHRRKMRRLKKIQENASPATVDETMAALKKEIES